MTDPCANTANCNLSSVMPGKVTDMKCTEFFDPQSFEGEKLMYQAAYTDLINSWGVTVNYYVHGFDGKSANSVNTNFLFGEDTVSSFSPPTQVKMYVQLQENALTLSRFGFASDDAITAYVSIETFESTFSTLSTYSHTNQPIRPKPGDLIEMVTLGCDRPTGRGAKIYEITEEVDQDVGEINPIMGHYVYRLRGKRYEPSFEVNAPQEKGNDQVYESEFAGQYESSITGELSSNPKSYDFDVNKESKDKIFDMNKNNTDIYGYF